MNFRDGCNGDLKRLYSIMRYLLKKVMTGWLIINSFCKINFKPELSKFSPPFDYPLYTSFLNGFSLSLQMPHKQSVNKIILSAVQKYLEIPRFATNDNIS
jgi:hypothetical protein